MKLRRLFVAVWLCIAGGAWAQYTIEGTVSDAENGNRLAGAGIRLNASNSGAITNDTGYFYLEVPRGYDKIMVQYLGYKSREMAVGQSGELNVQLEPGSYIEEVVVQSIRASDKAPVTHTTLDKREIQKVYKGEHPIYFLQYLTPGVLTESESGTSMGNYGTMRLRGMEQKRINFTLNGVPLNDMMDHGVYFSNFTDLSNSFESVQVQRGVGTATNGVASYAGSVNFETVNLERQPAGSCIQAGYGSYNSSRLNGQFSTGLLDSKWAFHGSYSKLHSDGYKEHTETDAYSFFFSAAYFGKKDAVKINAFDARSQNGLGYEPADRATLSDHPTYNPLNENDKDDFGQQLVQVQHIHSFGARLKWVNTLYYNGAGGDYLYGWLDDTGSLNQINYPLTNRHFGYMSQVQGVLSDQVSWSGGVHAYTFRRNNQEQMVPDFANPYYNEHSQKDEVSAFAKLSYRVGKVLFQADADVRTTRLSITPDFNFLGMASDVDLVKNWFFVNPRLGVAYDMYKSWQLYLSAGSTHREPTKVDILGGWGLYDSAQYVRLKQGIDFLSEQVLDMEGGVRFRGEDLKLEMNGYYMYFKNGILPTGETIEFGSQVRTNIPESYRMGVEAVVEYHPVQRITLSANVSCQQSRIPELHFTGDSIRYSNRIPVFSPALIVNAQAAYRITPAMELSLGGRYVSESYMTLQNESAYILPSYYLVNGRVHITFLKKHDLALEVNNITSQRYYTNGKAMDLDWDGVPDGVAGYLVNAPLNFFATLTLKFE